MFLDVLRAQKKLVLVLKIKRGGGLLSTLHSSSRPWVHFWVFKKNCLPPHAFWQHRVGTFYSNPPSPTTLRWSKGLPWKIKGNKSIPQNRIWSWQGGIVRLMCTMCTSVQGVQKKMDCFPVSTSQVQGRCVLKISNNSFPVPLHV